MFEGCVCHVCGVQADRWVRDYSDRVEADGSLTMIPGESYYLCKSHGRESRCTGTSNPLFDDIVFRTLRGERGWS